MNEELIEQVARALAQSHGLDWDEVCGVDADPDNGECDSGTCIASGYEDHDAAYARSMYRADAKATIAAMQPHIAAEREDAARRALEAAARECEGYAAWHNQHDDGLSGFGRMALGASEIADEIRAIDPAQFREAGNG